MQILINVPDTLQKPLIQKRIKLNSLWKYEKMTDKSLGTFINPFTDFGFKKIFGSEESKPLLISFLNDLLPIKNKLHLY